MSQSLIAFVAPVLFHTCSNHVFTKSLVKRGNKLELNYKKNNNGHVIFSKKNYFSGNGCRVFKKKFISLNS